ncbi:MAG: hypothetical protein Hals2KO_08730 [Halioglobus sp.]
MLAYSKRGLASGVSLLIACYSSPGLGEGRWNARAGASTSLTVTDNVCLEPNGDEVGWVTTFTPRASVHHKGRHSSLDLNGSVQMNSLTNSLLKSKGCRGNYDDREQYNPQLEAAYRRTIVPGKFTVTARGRVRQNEVSSRFREQDEFNRTANTNTYYRYWITPSYSQRLFGSSVAMNTSYTWDQLFNTSDLLTDSNRHRFKIKFTNKTRSRWSQNISAKHNITQFGENRSGVTKKDQEYGSANLGMGYRFSSKLAVNGSYGYDWSNFRSLGTNNTGGDAWSVGLSWSPSPRTSVRLSQGNRFFGNTPKIDISHQHKRSQFTLSYDKTLRFQRDIRTSNVGGFPGEIPNLDNPSIYTNDPIIDERLRGGWTYRGVRTNLMLTGNYSDQRRREEGEPYIFKNVMFTVAPNISTRYRFSGSVNWQEDEPREIEFPGEGPIDTLGKSQIWTYSLQVSRTFSQNLSTYLVYRFRDRDGSTELGDYQENSITATLSYTF